MWNRFEASRNVIVPVVWVEMAVLLVEWVDQRRFCLLPILAHVVVRLVGSYALVCEVLYIQRHGQHIERSIPIEAYYGG